MKDTNIKIGKISINNKGVSTKQNIFNIFLFFVINIRP